MGDLCQKAHFVLSVSATPSPSRDSNSAFELGGDVIPRVSAVGEVSPALGKALGAPSVSAQLWGLRQPLAGWTMADMERRARCGCDLHLQVPAVFASELLAPSAWLPARGSAGSWASHCSALGSVDLSSGHPVGSSLGHVRASQDFLRTAEILLCAQTRFSDLYWMTSQPLLLSWKQRRNK